MKFIWNFFFFGILFYLIWLVFPDTFMTLVSWANQIVAFFKELIVGVVDKVQHQTAPVTAPAESVKSLMMNLIGR
jgi:hypothetical protein